MLIFMTLRSSNINITQPLEFLNSSEKSMSVGVSIA